jgi:hypothetical protein
MRKSLTRQKYRMLLEILGRSKEPLSSYQILKKMGDLQDKYVYEMLEELYHRPVYPCFIWDKIPDDKNERNKFIDILRDVFNLAWIKNQDSSCSNNYNNDDDMLFEKSRDNKVLTISRGKHIRIKAKVDYYTNELPTGTLRIFLNDEEKEHGHITVNSMEGKMYLMTVPRGPLMLVPIRNSVTKLIMKDLDKNLVPITYLNQSLKVKSSRDVSRKINEITSLTEKIYVNEIIYINHTTAHSEQIVKLRHEISNIETNKRNWRYSLNIRGFILYLLGEIESQKQKKGNAEKKGRIHNIRITKVLENLSKYYTKEFPFLLYYDDFKNEYEQLAELQTVSTNFEIKLLKEIAEELQYQVHTASNDFLKYWVTRRFSGGITYYFTTRFSTEFGDVDQTLKYLSFAKLKEYMLTNLSIISGYLGNEYREMNGKSDQVTKVQLPVYY